jgi:ethylbenzene dioxygenase subunit beta
MSERNDWFFNELEGASDAQARRIEQFLIREARLLDARQYAAWANCLHDDFRYVVLNRFTPELRGKLPENSVDMEFHTGRALQFVEDTKGSIEKRLQRYTNGLSFSENPAGRTLRMVSNIEVGSDSDGFIVRSYVHCNRTRKDNVSEDYYACRKDRVIEHAGSLVLTQRNVLLNDTVLNAPALGIFL